MGEASWVLGIRAGALQLGAISVAPAELVGALGEEKGVGRGFKVPNVASLQGRGGVALNGFLVSLRGPVCRGRGLFCLEDQRKLQRSQSGGVTCEDRLSGP